MKSRYLIQIYLNLSSGLFSIFFVQQYSVSYKLSKSQTQLNQFHSYYIFAAIICTSLVSPYDSAILIFYLNDLILANMLFLSIYVLEELIQFLKFQTRLVKSKLRNPILSCYLFFATLPLWISYSTLNTRLNQFGQWPLMNLTYLYRLVLNILWASRSISNLLFDLFHQSNFQYLNSGMNISFLKNSSQRSRSIYPFIIILSPFCFSRKQFVDLKITLISFQEGYFFWDFSIGPSLDATNSIQNGLCQLIGCYQGSSFSFYY